MEEDKAAIDSNEDVEETTQIEETSEQTLTRDEMLETLAQKRKAELEEVPEDLEELDNEVEEEEIEEDAEEEEIEEDNSDLIDLNVYGKIIQKTRSEVEEAGGVVAMQKILAADQKFQEVAAERAELERLREEINKQTKAAEETEDETDADEIVDAFIESVYAGDEDQAKETFKKALSAAKQKTPQAIDEGRIVKETLFKLDQKQGIKDFEENFSHLSQDPHLRNMVNEATARIRNANPDESPSTIIRMAAEEVDGWVVKLAGGKESRIEEDVARKKKIHSIKPASTRQKQETGYKPKTQAEIFAEQRANRSH